MHPDMNLAWKIWSVAFQRPIQSPMCCIQCDAINSLNLMLKFK